MVSSENQLTYFLMLIVTVALVTGTCVAESSKTTVENALCGNEVLWGM